MKAALNLISELDEQAIRDVHSGDIFRSSLKSLAEESGFPKSAGEYAHRFIRAHENVEFIIAAYKHGVSHAMDAADAPEVEGNVADVTVKYPHGRPVRGLERLMRDHEMAPDEWEVDSMTVNEWPTTMGADEGVIYVNNFQAKARLSRKERTPKYERVQPVSVEAPDPPDVQPLDRRRPEGFRTALIVMDRQTGHRRDDQSWTYETIHDREAIDLAVQVAALAKPEVVVDVGDVLDFAGVSSYVGTPDLKRSLQPAICEAAHDNARLRAAAEAEEMHILEGNHDERLNEKLLEDAQEMYQLREAEAQMNGGPPAMSVPALLNLDDAGIEWHEGYPDNELLLNDGLAIEHGDTAKSDSGGTVRYMLKYETTDYSRIFGHIHRHEIAWDTTWKGQERRELCAASGGCLCRVDGGVPGVKQRQNWQQGLILCHYDPEGWKHLIEPARIYPETTGGPSVCWFRGQKLVADPPTPEELSHKTGFDFT
ncbi:hypothetical protein GGP94_003180 [Salinibacter ruber]|uniref:hypothetical protein n=1 Tax=Salinibacter ruber TaxID=146919 RepID=UPI00216817A8|nr:hypothetical protein [Salinibacter ruber]MCS4162732.1 hypothetical protein [Salinibacter ruber]